MIRLKKTFKKEVPFPTEEFKNSYVHAHFKIALRTFDWLYVKANEHVTICQ